MRNYLEYGGFPDVVKNKEKLKILREYSDLILFRDFIERHKLRNFNLAREIHTYIIQNFSKENSIKKLYNKLRSTNIKVTKDSVYNYVEKLEDTLFFFLKKYSLKPHLRESWPKKVYVCDTGLVKLTKFTPDYGRLMENIIYLELLI